MPYSSEEDKILVLTNLLIEALPYVESAEDDPIYKASAKPKIRALAQSIRRAVERDG